MKKTLLILLVLGAVLTTPAFALSEGRVGPDSPVLWRAELALDRVTELVRPSLVQEHLAERLAEYNASISRGDTLAAERVQVRVKARLERLKVEDPVLTAQAKTLDDTFNDKFSFTTDKLETIKANLNDALSSDFAQANVRGGEYTVTAAVKSQGATDYYTATMNDHNITSLALSDEEAYTRSEYKVNLSHGEFYSLEVADPQSMIRFLARVENRAGDSLPKAELAKRWRRSS